MSRRLADMATSHGREWSQDHFLSRASDADRSAALLRAVLRREGEHPAIPTTAAGT